MSVDHMKRVRELEDLMALAASNSEKAANRYAAHMALYNVAASSHDKVEIGSQRDTLHTLLDVILDTTVEVFRYQHEMTTEVRRLQRM